MRRDWKTKVFILETFVLRPFDIAYLWAFFATLCWQPY